MQSMYMQTIVYCLYMCETMYLQYICLFPEVNPMSVKSSPPSHFQFSISPPKHQYGRLESQLPPCSTRKNTFEHTKKETPLKHTTKYFFNRYPVSLLEIFQEILLKEKKHFSLANSCLVVKMKPNKVMTLMISYWRSPANGYI